jgi:hypothetical protein
MQASILIDNLYAWIANSNEVNPGVRLDMTPRDAPIGSVSLAIYDLDSFTTPALHIELDPAAHTASCVKTKLATARWTHHNPTHLFTQILPDYVVNLIALKTLACIQANSIATFKESVDEIIDTGTATKWDIELVIDHSELSATQPYVSIYAQNHEGERDYIYSETIIKTNGALTASATSPHLWIMSTYSNNLFPSGAMSLRDVTLDTLIKIFDGNPIMMLPALVWRKR